MWATNHWIQFNALPYTQNEDFWMALENATLDPAEKSLVITAWAWSSDQTK